MKEEKKSFYTLKADPVFKNVFYRDTNLLKRFLTDILSNFYDNLKIDNLEIQNTEISKDTRDLKKPYRFCTTVLSYQPPSFTMKMNSFSMSMG